MTLAKRSYLELHYNSLALLKLIFDGQMKLLGVTQIFLLIHAPLYTSIYACLGSIIVISSGFCSFITDFKKISTYVNWAQFSVPMTLGQYLQTDVLILMYNILLLPLHTQLSFAKDV